jgi:hypothetical protein
MAEASSLIDRFVAVLFGGGPQPDKQKSGWWGSCSNWSSTRWSPRCG